MWPCVGFPGPRYALMVALLLSSWSVKGMRVSVSLSNTLPGEIRTPCEATYIDGVINMFPVPGANVV